MSDLFSNSRPDIEEIYPDMFLLANFVETKQLLRDIDKIILQSPFRKMMTPNGHKTGIALANCGEYGWVSDIHGYRYSTVDPETEQAWPLLPESLRALATKAAARAGYINFVPDCCLINHYPIGSRLNSHQDKNEQDFNWPIVSVSIGLTAIFQVFGDERGGKPLNSKVFDGDVMVWGGKSRLAYHGVNTIKADPHNPKLKQRINVTFRKAY